MNDRVETKNDALLCVCVLCVFFRVFFLFFFSSPKMD